MSAKKVLEAHSVRCHRYRYRYPQEYQHHHHHFGSQDTKVTVLKIWIFLGYYFSHILLSISSVYIYSNLSININLIALNIVDKVNKFIYTNRTCMYINLYIDEN